jgi:V/A-type H+-transporting ATPase subunit C
MASISAHPYLRTRVHILGSRLRSEGQMRELLEAAPEKLPARLRLGRLLGESMPMERKLHLLEEGLVQQLLSQTAILLRPLDGSSRGVIRHWFQQFELFNLKALLRGKLNRLPPREIHDQLYVYDLPAAITLPHEELLRTESVSELLRKLEQGPYRDIAIQARRSFEENQESFLLDANIDQRFFAGLAEHARTCAEAERDAVFDLVGKLIDRQNLLWLLRYRFSYGLTASETYYLLVPHGRYLHRQTLMQLVNLNSFDRVIASLPPTLASHLGAADRLMHVEYGLNSLLRLQARRTLKASPSVTARALAFLVLREIELKRIFSLLQGRLLGLPEELIEQAMGLAEQVPGQAPTAEAQSRG